MFPAESDPLLKHERTVSHHQALERLYSVKASPAVSSSRLGRTAAPLLGFWGGPRIGSFLSRVPISSRPFHSPLSTKKKRVTHDHLPLRRSQLLPRSCPSYFVSRYRPSSLSPRPSLSCQSTFSLSPSDTGRNVLRYRLYIILQGIGSIPDQPKPNFTIDLPTAVDPPHLLLC
jgi:hypothetical protein